MNASELVKEYLASEGYRYDIDADGDIHFKYEGVNLYFSNDDRDPSFFRLFMPGIYQLEGNRVKVLEAINTVSRDLKAIKAFLVDDMLWLSIELFLDSTPEIDDFFPRCMEILKLGRSKMAEEIFG